MNGLPAALRANENHRGLSSVSTKNASHSPQTEKLRSASPDGIDVVARPRESTAIGNTWVARVFLHLSLLALQIIYNELFYLVLILRAMVIRYRDEHASQQHLSFPDTSITSFSSFGERIIQSVDRQSPSPSTASLVKFTSHPSSQEFHPKAKLIVGTESDNACNEHWGHFADFESVDDDDVTFTSITH